jgi:3'(2'), 5'-bisphosphate nucleotidase
MTDHAVAATAARAAGALLLEIRRTGLEGKALGAAGDSAAHALLTELLGSLRPNDAVLSEEGRDDRARLQTPRVWIVDPLDGTREYGEAGRTDWAVHVALVSQDGQTLAGAVALPGQNLTLTTDPARVVPPQPDRAVRVVASRTRTVPEVEMVAAALDAEIVRLGSAGAKAMAVVQGEVDVYVHSGGQYEWDSCAPVAVARAAGLHCSRIDGSPLRYNNDDVYLPDLVICRPALAAAVLEAVRPERQP